MLICVDVMDLLAFRTAAVKVQKSNHQWDQSSSSSSGFCHPPHASHSKTWSSPSHPHNQQDHCKCKLSLMTALLLARHHRRSLFFFITFVKRGGVFFAATLLSTFSPFCSTFPASARRLDVSGPSCFDVHLLPIVPAFLMCEALCLLSALVSGGFSPSSTATSGFSSQGSNTLPCPVPAAAPTSPRSSTGKRRNRKKDHKSSCMTKLPVLVFFPC